MRELYFILHSRLREHHIDCNARYLIKVASNHPQMNIMIRNV